MTVRELLSEGTRLLTDSGVPDAKVDASLLLSHVTGIEPLWLRANSMDAVSEENASAFRMMIARRAERQPLQYLTGEAWFCGRVFHTDSRALIPRPETALLAERAAEAMRAASSAPHALDLCCGSGCIGITLALEVPSASVDACDLMDAALSLSRENAAALGAKVRFFQGDLFGAVPEGERYHVIVSNPPYIETETCAGLQPEVLCEPITALDGGADGLDFYRRIAQDAPGYLFPGGKLLLEVGWNQSEAVCALLRDQGFENVCSHKDLQDIERMVEGTLPPV